MLVMLVVVVLRLVMMDVLVVGLVVVVLRLVMMDVLVVGHGCEEAELARIA